MSHQNAELVRRGYHAFAQGDIDMVRALLARDVTWHVPGRSPLSGDYRGHEQVLALLAKATELSGRTFRIEVDEVLAGGNRAAVLCTVAAERYGQCWSSPEIHLWRIADGRGVECREFQGDQRSEEEFWSA